MKNSKDSDFCRHFGTCGGCQFQDLKYQKQLEQKAEVLRENLGEFTGDGKISVFPSPEIFFYRNKMEFGFSHQVKRSENRVPLEFEDKFGLKEKGRWDKALDLTECRIFSPSAPELFSSVRNWAQKNELAYYDLRKHTGFLRHLLVREGKNTGEKMVVLFTAEGDLDNDGFLQTLEKSYNPTTVLWAKNISVSDVAKSNSMKVLKGEGFIYDRLVLSVGKDKPQKEITFKISPQSFFQTNTKATQSLYSRVREIASQSSADILYDLYGGSGGFSMTCHDLFEKCICADISKEAIEDGKTNAKLNAIDSIEFLAEKIEDFMPETLENPAKTLLILDPPRSGLHPKALKRVLSALPAEIIYVSCNPTALSRDLKALSQSYKIDSVEGFDLFPHTRHVETVVKLTLNSQRSNP
jgi:23S rRNA (uracil1939-C5)-methyltransferase